MIVPTDDGLQKERIRRLARRQRGMLLSVLACLVLLPCTQIFGKDPALAMLFGMLLAVVGLVGHIYFLLVSIETRLVWLWVASNVASVYLAATYSGGFLLVVLLSIIVVLIVNGQATRRLREAGLEVGLLGARYEPKEPQTNPSWYRCHKCGKDFELAGEATAVPQAIPISAGENL